MIREFVIFYATKENVLTLNHHILYILCLFIIKTTICSTTTMLNWTVVDQMCNNLLVYGVMKKILIKLSIVLKWLSHKSKWRKWRISDAHLFYICFLLNSVTSDCPSGTALHDDTSGGSRNSKQRVGEFLWSEYCFDAPSHTPYVLVLRIENRIHIVNIVYKEYACYVVKMLCMVKKIQVKVYTYTCTN